MNELILTSAQRQALKARAHDLRPVVLLGAAGLTEMVLGEIDRALVSHELIKIKVPLNDRGERAQVATEAAEKLSAAIVQSIGKIIVLFRPQPESEEKQEPDVSVHRRQTKGRATGRKTRD
jgi:RNA-binding protein